MPYIDPLKVVRNPETLAAYRLHQRQVWAAGMPWMVVAMIAASAEIVLFAYAMLQGAIHSLAWTSMLCLLVFGVCYAVGSFRMWRFRRANPFELP